ncbi:hypothetical protein AB0C91_10435 [Streptomyces sp. NPDC048674]|uniref:hypothetical protein n=1 Tax=Streptomyces sp. NPDC048674 TaxID=3155491 RepID=UPI003423E69A
MTLTIPFVGRRPKPQRKHRADDRIADLHASYKGQIADLRAENVTLLNRQAAADDFFAQLTNDVHVTNSALQAEQERRAVAEKELQQAEEAIRLRDRRIAELERKISVGVNAEHVIAETQELSADEIRRHCVKPMPLHQAPFATTNPGRVRPSWAVPEPAPAH